MGPFSAPISYPGRVPFGRRLPAYVAHIRQHKTPKSAQTDIYYLREIFGPVCDALKITSRRVTARKRPKKPGTDRRVRARVIEAPCFEQIATADIADFIHAQVQSKGLAPKTANRYREILCRLFNWATEEDRVHLPNGTNPAARVKRYRERAPDIRFLTLAQIDEQLDALAGNRQIQTMVAMYIYAGLRREEALWLTVDDVDLHAARQGMIRIRAKTINGDVWQPKTKVNRAVPVSAALARYLLRYTPRPSDHGWYFPSPEGTRWDADNFSADLRAAQRTAGLQWTCLDFRHTFGSHLAQNGVSLYKISTLLGNSPEICRRHYAALLPEAMHQDVDFATGPPSFIRSG